MTRAGAYKGTWLFFARPQTSKSRTHARTHTHTHTHTHTRTHTQALKHPWFQQREVESSAELAQPVIVGNMKKFNRMYVMMNDDPMPVPQSCLRCQQQ